MLKYPIMTRKDHPPIRPFIIICTVVLIIIVGSFALFNWLSSSTLGPASTIPSNDNHLNPYAILKPATVPSKTIECELQLSYDSNGNPFPLQCSNGDLNVLAWNSLAALEPVVMKLGYSPSKAQVISAICTDGNVADLDSTPAISAPLETSVYQISALYYGWNFNINPSSILSNGSCN